MSRSKPPDTPDTHRSGSSLYVLASSGELEFERVAFFSDSAWPRAACGTTPAAPG